MNEKTSSGLLATEGVGYEYALESFGDRSEAAFMEEKGKRRKRRDVWGRDRVAVEAEGNRPSQE